MLSNITKRKIHRFLKTEGNNIFGELSEGEFINIVFNANELPSHDSRFNNLASDHRQHRINNPEDWSDDWRLEDARTGIMYIEETTIINLLEFIVNPECRLDHDSIEQYKNKISDIINPDGYMFIVDKQESGHNIYKIIKIEDSTLHIPESAFDFDEDSSYYSKIKYAKGLFWNNGSTIHQKKSAIKELADVLENLRTHFANLQLSGDESDIFNIANNYELRHSNSRQRNDYDHDIFMTLYLFFTLIK